MGYEVIKTLAKKKDISLESIADHAGLSYNSLSKIIRNTINEPKFTTMQLVAEALGMTTDQLAFEVGLSKIQDSDLDFTISESERKHIIKYRQLNQDGQRRLDENMDDLLGNDRYKKGTLELSENVG